MQEHFCPREIFFGDSRPGAKSPLVGQAARASFSFPTMESLSGAPTWRDISLPPLLEKARVGIRMILIHGCADRNSMIPFGI